MISHDLQHFVNKQTTSLNNINENSYLFETKSDKKYYKSLTDFAIKTKEGSYTEFKKMDLLSGLFLF